MSVIYCEDCGQYIDTDFDAEHFDTPHLDESGDFDSSILTDDGLLDRIIEGEKL